MTKLEKITTCITEGTDDVGKMTVTTDLVRALLTADAVKIGSQISVIENHSYLPFEVIFTNYPMYFLHSGTLIREMNTVIPGSEETMFSAFVDSQNWKEEETSESLFLRELNVRESFYALERLIPPIIINIWRDIWHYERDIIVASDRGFISNLNTAAGVMISHDRKFDMDLVLSTILEKDSYFREYFKNPQSVILHKNQINQPGKITREVLDWLELPEFQKLAIRMYEMVAQIPEFNAKIINIYEGERRKSREEMLREFAKKFNIEFMGLPEDMFELDLNKLVEDKNFSFISPSNFIGTFYPRINKELGKNVMQNIEVMERNWRSVYFSNETYSLETFGKKKKIKLAELEQDMSWEVARISQIFEISDDVLKRIDYNIRIAGRKLLGGQDGDLMKLILFLEEKKGYPNGLSKFVKRIFLNE